MSDNLRLAVAEAVGTAVLVVGGCGTAIFAAADPPLGSGVGALGVATAFGLSLLVMAYTIGPVSGCHVNPAVTIGLMIAGKVERKAVPAYLGGQLVGGLLGGVILRVVLKLGETSANPGFATNGFGDRSPRGYQLPAVIVTEIALTALLVLVVLGTTHRKASTGFGGLAVGAALWLVHLISIPIDNTSVNPARSLAVAPWATGALGQVWVFLIFPVLGAVVAAIVWRVIANDQVLPDEPPAVTAADADEVVWDAGS